MMDVERNGLVRPDELLQLLHAIPMRSSSGKPGSRCRATALTARFRVTDKLCAGGLMHVLDWIVMISIAANMSTKKYSYTESCGYNCMIEDVIESAFHWGRFCSNKEHVGL